MQSKFALTSFTMRPASALRSPHIALAAIAAAIGNALILIRAAMVASPLYTSDEVVYWHRARALFAEVDAAAFTTGPIYIQDARR
jgi:hypothetical protein